MVPGLFLVRTTARPRSVRHALVLTGVDPTYVSVSSAMSCRFVSSSRGDAFMTWIKGMAQIPPRNKV